MGFFRDLKQDLSQTVADINADETLGDMALDTDMPTSSEELLDSVAGEAFADAEATLEKEVQALNDESMTVLEENASEELISGLEGTEGIDTELPTKAVFVVEEPAEVPDSVLNEDVRIPDIDMPVVEEENKDSEISEVDAEMEELLSEVEQNIEESTLEAAPKEAQEANMETSAAAASTDTAIITVGMNITGDVTSSGNMDLIGNITGNIEILGKLNVTGGITGNSSAAEIYAESAQINGEIKSKGSVKIGQSSVVIGNIFATSAVIAGAVKGDIDVHGPVILDTSAIVMGNIKSKSVQINNGAVIEGMCSQCYADISPTSFFNDVKKNRKQS